MDEASGSSGIISISETEALDFSYEPIMQESRTEIRQYRMSSRAPAQVYYCEQCDKHIKYPSKIAEHIRKHTGEKPFRCSVCGQLFSQGHSLKNHMVLHGCEKPYKCSYCSMSFFTSASRNAHQKAHNQDNGSCNLDCGEYIEIVNSNQQNEQFSGVFECPLSCGFVSLEDREVEEHLNVEHEEACWEVGQQTVDVMHVDNGMGPHIVKNTKEFMCQEDVVVEPVYEYYDDPEFVEHHPEGAQNDEPCTSDTVTEECAVERGYYQKVEPLDALDYQEKDTPVAMEEIEIQTSSQLLKDEVMYQEEQFHKEDGVMIQEHQIPPLRNHLYGQIVMDDIVQVVGDDDEDKVRVVVNPYPPRRGAKSQKYQENIPMTEVVVDAATLEMAAPVRHLKQGFIGIPAKKRVPTRSAHNLDWIIDAVARGVDVNSASPYQRKKPAIHKCQYCGKIDKYPSKIKAHMRTHTGEKPFKCDICGMAFSQRTPMRLHLRRHFDQKPYECLVEGCKERFVSGSLLKIHVERKHLNKKKYVCFRGCGRVFSSAHNQRVHEAKCSHNTFENWNELHESEEEYHEDEEYDYGIDNSSQDEEINSPDAIDGPSTSKEPIVETEPVFLHQ